MLVPFLLLVAAVCVNGRLYIQGDHFYYNGQRVFFNGVNQAWVSYGYDWGNNQYQYRRSKFQSVVNDVKNNGGNSIRVWVHVEGQTSPHFDNHGHVTGTDSSNSLIHELTEYLQYARNHQVFIFLCLWNGAERGSTNWRLEGLIKDTGKLHTYINHALIPMVKALKDQPALAGWDIINEMEGVLNPNLHNSEPCFDTTFLAPSGAGWKGHIHSAQDLLRFINWQAAAIRKTDPQALVTAGSWNPKSNTNMNGMKNLYSDHCLIRAGHDNAGTLNFYSTHTYDNKNTHQYDSYSPFKHNKNQYGLGKPLIIAEFNQVRGGHHSIEELFTYAYYHGYAGAWSWHANADGSDTDDFPTQQRGMRSLRGKNDQNNGGLINITI